MWHSITALCRVTPSHSLKTLIYKDFGGSRIAAYNKLTHRYYVPFRD